MNKIYKVVWNKARNCYVVVSEFAKNHQTGSSRIKAASVAAVMAATMLTIGTGVIYAANVTDTDEKEPKETILFDNKQNETTKLNDPNLTHHNPDYPSVHGHTDRCGELTYNTTLTIGDINKVADALVANDKLLYNQGIKNVTMNNGTISLIRNDNSRVTDSIALTGNDGKNGQDTAVTVTVGNKSQKFQTGSVVTAKTDTSGKATGLTINGKSYDIKAGKTYKAGENVTIADDGTISATDTTYSAGKNVKIDDKNKISVDLSEYAKSDDVAVVYQDNDKNKSLHSTNAGTVGSSSIALGKEATTGSRSVALGDQTKATGQSSTAIGTSSQATAENAVALGGAAKANVYGGVALGTSSVADRAAEAGVVGAFASEGADGLTWKANAGAVSVGSDTITRQITNVAAGSEATDAVNVAQLKAATENAGWNLSTEKKITQPTKVKSGAIVDFSGDDENITISKEETDFATFVKVNLNRNLNVDSVQAGDFFMNNEKGIGFGGNAYITKDGLNANDKVITNVAEGVYNTDAVNVGQLKKVEEVAANANKGWNLSTNGVATEATNVAPGEYVDFSGDKNISVSHDGTKVKVELNKDIDVNYVQTNALNAKYNLSVGTANADGTMPFFVNSTGAFYAANNKFSVDKDGKVTATAGEIGNVVLNNGVFYKNSALRDGELFIGDADGNYSQITPKSAKLGQVTIDEKGNIAGVNSIQTNALNAKYNLSVGTANENGTVPFFVNSNGAFYGANGSFVVDKDGKVTATAGEIGNVVLQNGVYTGHSALRDGELFVGDASGNYSQITTKGAKLGKVTVAEDGKITGVAAGAITADSTDAVNGSQLHAVATEAGKHSKVVNGSNINVEEFDNDGQKIYKVNLNKDIMLGDLTGKYVNISGTNGTIETTGYIATNDRVYADKGAKLADIDVTGNKISNGASSIVLDGSNVKVNDKVTIDQNGKISGVAKGEVSKNSTDAINGSQLNQTNENVAALDKRVTQNEADIAQNKADIAQNKADIAQNKADIAQNKADIVQNKTDIKNLDNRVTNVEELAKKHTTVTEGDNIAVTESTNKDGGKEYKVALDKDINLDSVTTGQTVMNNDGLKVGKDVSVTATAVTAGKTSISDEGVKVGDKTYISDKGLNANDQKVTNVAAGELSATSKDAVNGSQLYETNQAIANNATNISSLSHSISNLDNRVNKVGAGAAALAALHPLDFDPDAKWDFAAGYGNYRGANAAAVGAYYRPNEDTMFSVGGTFGNGENMVNAGVSFKLGSGSSHVSTSRVAMAKEIKELRGELEAMKSAMLDANAGKKIDTSKLQLFPDVPQNHWAYEYVAQLAGNGMIEGYPDGNFAGDRPMTRYEFAAILYRAMMKGAVLSDKILSEFSHELEYFTVDTIAKDKAGNPTIQRVRTVKENKNK